MSQSISTFESQEELAASGNLVSKYMTNIGKMSKWRVTWRDMSRNQMFSLLRKVRTKFKSVVMSSRVVSKWNEDVEDIETKNVEMLTKDVVVISCDELSDREVYAFASVQEGVDFAKLVKQLVTRGIPASSAISVAYNHIDRKHIK